MRTETHRAVSHSGGSASSSAGGPEVGGPVFRLEDRVTRGALIGDLLAAIVDEVGAVHLRAAFGVLGPAWHPKQITKNIN